MAIRVQHYFWDPEADEGDGDWREHATEFATFEEALTWIHGAENRHATEIAVSQAAHGFPQAERDMARTAIQRGYWQYRNCPGRIALAVTEVRPVSDEQQAVIDELTPTTGDAATLIAERTAEIRRNSEAEAAKKAADQDARDRREFERLTAKFGAQPG